MTLGEVCEHGSLKRQCRNCELMSEIDRMVADTEKTERQLKAADALAKAAKSYASVNRGDPYVEEMEKALAAYEKVRK